MDGTRLDSARFGAHGSQRSQSEAVSDRDTDAAAAEVETLLSVGGKGERGIRRRQRKKDFGRLCLNRGRNRSTQEIRREDHARPPLPRH